MITTMTARRGRVRLTRRRLIGVLALGLVAAISAWWFRPRPPGLPVVQTLTVPHPRGWPLAFSPDGTLLITTVPNGGIQIWEVATGKLRATCSLGGWTGWAVVSPDSQTVVASSLMLGPPRPSVLSVFRISDGSLVTSFEVDQSIHLNPRFTPDGSTFELVTWDNAQRPPAAVPWVFRSWDTANWQPAIPRPLAMKQQDVFVLSSGRHSAITGNRKTAGLTLWDLTTETPTSEALPVSESTEFGTHTVGFSQSDQTLVRVRTTGPIEIWDLKTKSRSSVFQPYSPGHVIGPWCFSSDERTLITL